MPGRPYRSTLVNIGRRNVVWFAVPLPQFRTQIINRLHLFHLITATNMHRNQVQFNPKIENSFYFNLKITFHGHLSHSKTTFAPFESKVTKTNSMIDANCPQLGKSSKVSKKLSSTHQQATKSSLMFSFFLNIFDNRFNAI